MTLDMFRMVQTLEREPQEDLATASASAAAAAAAAAVRAPSMVQQIRRINSSYRS